ncbi:MAG: hypothetical protein IPL79_00775 [Myxococcales bacterium]|nr:hypothetical protein [Myxococcales bacterium]
MVKAAVQRRALPLVGVLQLLLLAPAAGDVRPPRGGEVVLSSDSTLANVGTCGDPSLAHTAAELGICRLFYEPLYVARRDGVIVPRLAAGPIAWSADQTVATIELRADIGLHDGRALTAADVADALLRASRSGRFALTSVAADEARLAVVLTLPAPRPWLAAELSAPWMAIATRGVGSGPFVRLSTSADGATWISAQRFANYWGTPAWLDKLAWLPPSDAAREARQYHRGATWWSHVGGDASGLPSAHAETALYAPLIREVSLVRRGRAMTALPLPSMIDTVALALDVPFARALPMTLQVDAASSQTQTAQTVPLYFDQDNARLRHLAAKVAWQLSRHGVIATVTSVKYAALGPTATVAEEALVLVDVATCPACAALPSPLAEAPARLTLLRYGHVLSLRQALQGVEFDGWGMPLWEAMYAAPAAGDDSK